MTDYAQATAADPSWTWWMTTAAAAVRMRNLQNHHHHGDVSGGSDVDDEYAGPGGKRQRVGDVKDECWPVALDRNDRGALLLRHRLEANDTASAGPLDLSVKATLTTTAARIVDGRAGHVSDMYPAPTTPEKPHVATATVANRGKSSKKSTAGGTVTATTAIKAATRKLLPQLMLDRHVDRSSPVSGTIIVPATPEEPMAAGCKRLQSSSSSLSSSSPLSSPPYSVPADCGKQEGDPRDDEYDGGDIDPEFNVVVATDEARRRIESIPNALGPYRCRLCGVRYADAFALARHRCRCIVHVRYTCPECDKVFQCPANLASHRRWHGTGAAVKTITSGGGNRNKNDDNSGKPVNAASNIVNDIASVVDVNDGDGGSVTTAPVTTASGFKKNMLQRAVQAAAAAAANNNNNNGDDENDNDKNRKDDNGDIAK